MSDSDHIPDTPLAAPVPAKPPANAARTRLFMIFGGVLTLIAIGWGAWTLIEGGRWVKTDNAYVQASTATVSPLINGTIKAVKVSETQVVKEGDVLVLLDDADARLALAQAEARLDQVQRQVMSYYAQDAGLAAQTGAAVANVANAEAAFSRAEQAYNDRLALAGSGAVSGEEVSSAKTARDQAQAALYAARAQAQAAEASRGVNATQIGGVEPRDNPQVIAARVAVEKAQLDLDRTVIRAPIGGVIARNSADIGAGAQIGAPLMTVVPMDQVYVNANFKEVQLKDVRPGQSVELTSDLYGHNVVFHGKVVGLAGGTGSAFALIPAQNATGNWIKVVQRVPVRVALDPKELNDHALRVGMSMTARVRVKD